MLLTCFVSFFISPSVHFMYIEKNLLSTSYVASIMLDAEATKVLNKTLSLSSKDLQTSNKNRLKDNTNIA